MPTSLMPSAFYSAVFLLFCASLGLAEPWTIEKMVQKSSQGKTTYHGLPTEDKFLNPWPEKLEQEFQARAARIIKAQSQVKAGLNTYFENEKRSYGFLMAHAINGNSRALELLQGQDHQHQQWHKETAGIDYYAAFTLKHQMRKYFYFGDIMEPEYRKQMYEGAKRWTAKDPLRRPHYAYEGPKPGWGPDAKNSWVDVRTTENLFLMRVTSVYLMAEETKNQATTSKYKQIILDYTKSLYRIGMGEWDSENYHGHSIAPLLNLYDFAKDEDVKLAAKACLDWMCAAGAVKYFRGAFTGPTKRDYNHAQPFGGSAAGMLWVWFGDSVNDNEHFESDEIHSITSSYRPPLAVVELARKQHNKPVTIYAAKPHYTATTTFDLQSSPAYLETQYIANTFQLGSLAGGTRPGADDVNGFKIVAKDKAEGAIVVQAIPGPDPGYVGSPMYQSGKVAGENRVAQYENLAIWLVKNGNAPWSWVLPETVKVSSEKGITFLELEETWIALHPLGTSQIQIDKNLRKQLDEQKKVRFPGHTILSAKGNSKYFCGVLVEIGEKLSHGSFAKFKSAVQAGQLNTEKLNSGVVDYKTEDGKWLGIHWQDDPHNLGVWKNGKRHDFQSHAKYLYHTGDFDLKDDSPLIYSAWGEGKFLIHSKNAQFESSINDQGKVSFTNQ